MGSLGVLGVSLGAAGIASASSTTTPVTPATPATPAPAGGWGGHGPFGGMRPAAVGTVKAVTAGGFTVAARSGTTVTVDVSKATTYRDRSVTSPGLANVKVGEVVAVVGQDTANTVAATQVLIGGPGGPGGWGGHGPFGGMRPAAVGTVKAVTAIGFTVAARSGTTVTVDVSKATTYRDRSVTSPGLANVKVGEVVAVVGQDTADTVAATQVLIGGPGAWGGPGGPRGAGPWAGGTGGRPAGPGGYGGHGGSYGGEGFAGGPSGQA